MRNVMPAARSVAGCLRRSLSRPIPPNSQFPHPALLLHALPSISNPGVPRGIASQHTQDARYTATAVATPPAGTAARPSKPTIPGPPTNDPELRWSGRGGGGGRSTKDSSNNRRNREPDELPYTAPTPAEQALSTERLYEALEVAARKGRLGQVRGLVRYLIRDRGQTPNARVYSALIVANIPPEVGSAAAVGVLLEEMRAEGVDLDARLCHNVLEALSVHVDFLLRNEIVDHMRQRWFSLTQNGHHFIAAGLLREAQFELALEKMDEMRHQQIPIQTWLYDLAGYMLAEAGEIDEAFRMVKLRESFGETTIPPMLWYHLLDHASSSFHLDATVYVWKKRVQPEYLNPPDGVCFNILNTAARHGDAQLATDVFRVLGNRNTIFDIHHYEMLADTYAAAGDISAALSVFGVMRAAGVTPDDSSTRSTLDLVLAESHADDVFEILSSLKEQGRPIPTAAYNLLLDAATQQSGAEAGLERYKALHTICEDGPDVETFNILIRACRIEQKKDLAMFLAAEMVALKVKPNARTYERLIEVCVLTGAAQDALSYYDEMLAQGFTRPRSGTVHLLVADLMEKNDEALWRVLDQLRPPMMYYQNVIRSAIQNADQVPGYDQWAPVLERRLPAGREQHGAAGGREKRDEDLKMHERV